ncbi:cyclic nucleotide-binding domain-containing protein [Reinekea sp.]|jgi:hypothetical protein|uniref:Crp/Fnr family transcriptional regulator n=1 Tax=Reinekea sp. TaxID=1970455 RepID=UPI002A80F524|nr:cyclic nucleotide-binding domain-containing protein [Reinekea sp.]
MLVMVMHPDNWLHRAQRQQFLALQHFGKLASTVHTLQRDEIAEMPVENWAYIRVRSGVIGLELEDVRLLALESGDSWLGYPGGLMNWFQEGTVEIEVWSWQDVATQLIPAIIQGYSDLMLALINHNIKVVPDPMPGFEFFDSGDVIILEGDVADSVYTLIQGRAKVMVNDKQVGEAKENEILGLQAMLLKTTRTASVIADGPCSAVKVTYDKFRSLIESRPELVISTLETMALQMQRANQRMTKN